MLLLGYNTALKQYFICPFVCFLNDCLVLLLLTQTVIHLDDVSIVESYFFFFFFLVFLGVETQSNMICHFSYETLFIEHGKADFYLSKVTQQTVEHPLGCHPPPVGAWNKKLAQGARL